MKASLSHSIESPTDVLDLPEWRRSLLDYDRLSTLDFSSREDFRAATRMIFSMPDLKGVPYHSGGLNSIILPEAAAVIAEEALNRKHVKPSRQEVRNLVDLPPSEAADIRKQPGFLVG